MSSRPLLPQPIDAEPVEQSEDPLRDELDELREDLDALRSQYERDRRTLTEFMSGLRALLSGGSAAASGATVADATQPIPSAVYDAWKQRLPPACGKIIDALLVQPMTNLQLKKFCKLGKSTVPQMITILVANKLVEKQGAVNCLRRPS